MIVVPLPGLVGNDAAGEMGNDIFEVPFYKGANGNGYAEAGARWSFLRNGRFDIEDELVRLKIFDPNNSENLIGISGRLEWG